MNFNISSFDAESIESRFDNAEARRANGRLIQNEIDAFEEFKNNSIAIGETQGKPAEIVLQDFIEKNPEQVENIKNYLQYRGYEPSEDLVELCMQCAYARGEHINEVVSAYDEDNFLWGGKGRDERLKRRLARRKARVEARAERKAIKRKAKADAEAAEMQANPEAGAVSEQTASAMQQTPAQTVIATEQGAGAPLALNPTPEEAHAEILGQEAEAESYNGESKDWGKVLNAAVDLGTRQIAAIKEAKAKGEKVNLKKFVNLLTKNAKQSAQPVIEQIEQEKKMSFLRENAPLLIVAIIGIAVIGYSLKK